MLTSYNWLKHYIKGDPSPEKVAEVLTFSVFEIDSLEKKGDDFVLDVKVLPDRACYALCHRGIARELAGALSLQFSLPDIPLPKDDEQVSRIEIIIENAMDCRRYMARRVENVEVRDSPDWLKKRLETIGQRSINNIVDFANLAMFDCGQPLHAFDADKVKGEIRVKRVEKEGTYFLTLDGKEIFLSEGVLVITDNIGPLAIAGIKGGKRAEVNKETKNIILESANFDPTLIRKTSFILNIRTDASKRFENSMSPSLCIDGINELSFLISTNVEGAIFGEINDIYESPQKDFKIEITEEKIRRSLGVKISLEDAKNILQRIDTNSEISGKFLIADVPPYRMDIRLTEDLIEEVGRLFGYTNIQGILPEKSGKVETNEKIIFHNRIRELLSGLGFSEIITSSFYSSGELEILKPLAKDKAFLRQSLLLNVRHGLVDNLKNAPLLEMKTIKIFEIGSVFSEKGEESVLCVGVKGEKSADILKDVVSEIEKITEQKPIIQNGIFEISIDNIPSKFKISDYEDIQDMGHGKRVIFKSYSQFPFIARDIAVFVGEDISANDLWKVITSSLPKDGKELLANHYLFDEFKKGDKTSFAFRLIFQSFERTLTDDEVNLFMGKINKDISDKGWQVR